jgi:hypothetical protein
MHLFAGMPTINLTDVARMRLENISFFVAGFFISALLIKLVWNYLASDWTFLPRLSYCKALGIVALWGLLFVLVLTMISGARELMTPGAWEKKGFVHQLVNDRAKQMQERKERLGALKDALWKYADAHDNKFPSEKSDPALPASIWDVPHPSEAKYLYVGGRRYEERRPGREAPIPVAFEPELFGPERLVLCANGDIRIMSSDEIAKAMPWEAK